MTGNPVVSVITPTYRHERYIEESLRSVVAQTFPDWEVIVVDDGSDDGTVERSRSIHDPRIRVLAREHVGTERLADTYNAALAECRGTFVAVLEGDDRWRPHKLARQLEIMRDPGVVVAYARYATFGSRGRILTVPPLAGPVRRGFFDALGPMLLDSFVEVLTAMIRRDALVAAGGFRQLAESHPHVDYPTMLAVAEHGLFHASDDVVADWRRHAGAFTVQSATLPASFAGPALCRDLALRTRRRHAQRTELPSEPEIASSWSRVLARRYWQSGRVLLANSRWSAARRHFALGLGTGSATIRQRAMLAAGIAAATVHVDLERAAALFRGGSSISDL